MLKIQVVLGKNDVMAISEALKAVGVGGLTVYKMRGRGKNPGPEIHASKGTEVFVPQFAEKYGIDLIIPDSKEDEIINIIKEKGTVGKIFITPVTRAVDIGSGEEGDKVI